MRKTTVRAIACSLAAVVAFSALVPAKTANAQKEVTGAAAKTASFEISENRGGSPSASEETTLYLTADMADKGQIMISGGTYERIVVPKEIGSINITLDKSEVGELVVESGSKASILLRATTAAKVTVEEPKLKEIDWTELKHLLADAATSQQAIEYYTRVQTENEKYLSSSPRITTANGAVIGSLTAGAGVSLNLYDGEVGSLNVKSGTKLTHTEIAVEGYHGDITYTGNDSFGIVSLKLKNSEVGRMTVVESCGNNYLLVSGRSSYVDNIEVAGNAKVSLNIPADTLTITADTSDARVDVLNKVDSMSIAADNARIEIASIGSVASAEVSGNKVSIGGSGTLGEVDITGKSASVSTNGTTVKGENTYTPPIYTAPVVTVAPTTRPTPTPTTKPTPTTAPTPTTGPTPTTEPTPDAGFVAWEDAGLEDHIMDWKDAGLEAVMREATGITERDIMLSDVWEMRKLHIEPVREEVNINSSSDLSEMINLAELTFIAASINDFSILSELVNLKKLEFMHLRTSVDGDNDVWEKLINLEELSFFNTKIDEFRQLSVLSNLKRLSLFGSGGVDGLSGLANLKYLNWQDECIVDNISELSELINLEELFLYSRDTGNIDISVLSGLMNLKKVCLSQNNISNISALSGLTNLDNLDLSENNISDIEALSELTKLTWLKLSDNEIKDISVLAGLTNLTELYLSGNEISDITALAGLTNLTHLDLYGNPITDYSPVDHVTFVRK